MCQWFYCGEGKAIVTSDLRVGGNYENAMVMKVDEEKGVAACGSSTETHVHSGKYLEIVPPEKLVFTWSSAIVTDSRVTVVFKDLGDSTELTLTHELLETEDLRQKHTYGWNGCLENLEKHFCR